MRTRLALLVTLVVFGIMAANVLVFLKMMSL